MDFIRRNPTVWVLLGVFLYLVILLSSYGQVWMLPEEFRIKSYVLHHGSQLNAQDLRLGLNWQVFESAPRLTRPLSSYFEIIDTKFRAWVWHYWLPHPSLSLTWIFSLILSPLLLFLLLRNLAIEVDVALGAVALYLMSPGFLSFVVMLFRPGKAMTNFSIILCLYLASRLIQRLDKDRPGIFFGKYLGYLSVMLISIFWDETAVLIYPLGALFFPRLLADKKRLMVFLFIPVLVFFIYFYFFPFLVVATGNPRPLSMYDHLPKLGMFPMRYTLHYLRAFVVNSALLTFDSLGLVRLAREAPAAVKILMGLNAAVVFSGIGYAVYYWVQLSRRQHWGLAQYWPCLRMALGAVFLFSLHTYLMIETRLVFWGPFWYGVYWEVFFVILMACLFNRLPVNKYVFALCMAVICFSLANTFGATNQIYKKSHYYPYAPTGIICLFRGDYGRFGPQEDLPVSGDQIKDNLRQFWITTRAGGDTKNVVKLLGENLWAGIEMQPGK